KNDRPVAELLAEWHERAEAVGLNSIVIAGILDRERTVTIPDPDPVQVGLLSDTGLTAEDSTFGRPEVIRGFAAYMPEGGTRRQIEVFADRFLTDDQVALLVPDRSESRYTTADLLATEQRIITRAVDGVGIGRWTAAQTLVAKALERHTHLNEGQRSLVSQFATSGNSIEVGAGPAGTGKSAALAVIRELAEATGAPILGTALAARTAAGFERDTDIPSTTLASLLGTARDQGLAEGVVVVVDEAGMVGTRQLAGLSDLVEETSGKLILIGDHYQLSEIEAGGLFRALTQRLPAVELTENLRQTEPWERAALTELRDGSASRAVDIYGEKGRIVTTDCPIEAVEMAVKNWHHDVEEVGDISQVLLIAYRNTTVDRLNQQARSRIDQAGHLEGPALTAEDRTF
ncbi:MAG: AAA family ATPase, partial [Acidimicrobiia bacterium]